MSVNNKVRFRAFTLAEVLITLGIIGVVAAMTMPALINSTQKKELQTGLKVGYSAVSQAFLSVAADEGIDLKPYYTYYVRGDKPNTGSYVNAAGLNPLVYEKLKVVGKCSYKEDVRNYTKTAVAYIDRGKATPDQALANGMCFNVQINAAQINVTIDVNGTKKPNALGHDIFFFQIDNQNRLVPIRQSSTYTDDEIKDMEENSDSQWGPNISSQAGNPCSHTSKQRGNGMGCAYYALINQNPDNPAQTYWKTLP